MTFKPVSLLLLTLCLLSACRMSLTAPATDYPPSGTLLEISKSVTRMPDWEGSRVRVDAHMRHPDSSCEVYGGKVTLDGVEIEPCLIAGATVYHNLRPTQPVPLTFGVGYHTFTVAGTPQFPGLQDSIRMLGEETIITDPMPGARLSRSADLTLRWQASGDADGTYLSICDTPGDTSATKATREISRTLPGDPGVYVVHPRELAVLRPGPLSISVTRRKLRVGYTEGRRYMLSIASTQSVTARLTP